MSTSGSEADPCGHIGYFALQWTTGQASAPIAQARKPSEGRRLEICGDPSLRELR
jgi:hypothetical protein